MIDSYTKCRTKRGILCLADWSKKKIESRAGKEKVEPFEFSSQERH